MYGLYSTEIAEQKAAELRQRHPENRYEVRPHSWTAYGNVAKTWGVVAFEPYCEQMPWRLAGFVWFVRESLPLPLPR